jgi:hypothetical protein
MLRVRVTCVRVNLQAEPPRCARSAVEEPDGALSTSRAGRLLRAVSGTPVQHRTALNCSKFCLINNYMPSIFHRPTHEAHDL